MSAYSLQNILSGLRKAVTDYKMISDGDHVVVGLSGGKDSIVLVTALKAYQRFSPEKFSLTAVNINIGFKDTKEEEVERLKAYLAELNVPFIREDTQIAQIVFDERKESNPCSLCAKMRRGALNDVINRIGANKLALGHNADDVAETFLMSLLFEGRISTFQPVSYMDRSGVTLIRPLIYIDECDVKSITNKMDMPIVHNPCPSNFNSRRQWAKDKISELGKEIPFAKDRIKSAIFHPERNNLWVKPTDENGKD